MTLVTLRWLVYDSENYWEGFSWSLSCAWSLLIVFTHRSRLIMCDMTKHNDFFQFLAKLLPDITLETTHWLMYESENYWKGFSWSLCCDWGPLIVFRQRSRLITMSNLRKHCDFLRFWAELPPEMTLVTPRCLVDESRNYWNGFSESLCCGWSPLMMFIYRLRSITMSNTR
jgi:hypothetical protein